MTAPVDAARTDAWNRLSTLAEEFTPDLRAWFDHDPGRVDRLTFTAADLHVDLSKNLLDDEVLAALLALADQVGLVERRDAMFRGERINVTEGRAVLHTALRAPRGTVVEVDGHAGIDLREDAGAVLRRLEREEHASRGGRRQGHL